MITTLEELNLKLNLCEGEMFMLEVKESVYRDHAAVSQSELKLSRDKSLKHLQHARVHKKVPTDSMKLGTAAHTAIFEPELFDVRYLKAPKLDLRKTADKERAADLKQQAEMLDKEILDEETYDDAWKMRECLMENLEVAELLQGGIYERSSFAHVHGVHAKIRTDSYRIGDHLVTDLKTTKSASKADFARDIRTFKMHWQACWYSDVIEELHGTPPGFKIIALENTPPHCSRVFTIKADLMTIARRELMIEAAKVRAALESGIWPGYSGEVVDIGAHRWEWEEFLAAALA